jgi:hypothetical protein
VSDEFITEEQLAKLAQDMVATATLSTLYGIELFMTAKSKFEAALKQFATQQVIVTLPNPQDPPSIQIDTGIPPIPSFIK